MKKCIVYLLCLSVAGGLFGSCYDDKSTEKDRDIPGVTIQADNERIEALYGKELIVAPVVEKNGDPEARLSYLWLVNVTRGSSDLLEIGDKDTLRYVVGNAPNSSPYDLILKVTDEVEGLSYYQRWDLYVSNSFGEGLVVGYTRDGGATSDLDFVKAPEISYEFTGDADYIRQVYSLANMQPLEGKVTSLLYNLASGTGAYNISRIYVGTDRDFQALDPLSFAVSAKNGELFYQGPFDYQVRLLSNACGLSTMALVGSRLYGYVCSSASLYGSPLNYVVPEEQVFTDHIAVEQGSQVRVAALSAYDETNGYFLYAANVLAFNNGTTAILTQQAEEGQFVFDPGNLTGKKALKAGIGTNGAHLHLLQDAVTGQDTVFKLDRVSSMIVTGTGKIDMSRCTAIGQAVDYAFSEIMDVMYYATPTEVYAAVMTTTSAGAARQWQVENAAEKITRIGIYQQTWMGVGQNDPDVYPFINPTHQHQLLVTTYNSSTGEGKIYLLPIVSYGSGALGEPTRVLDGFGEITAIGTTLK